MKYDSLEEQEKDGNSIYNYVKQVIRVRNQNPVIARGTTAYLEQYSGEQCFALTRSYEGSNLLLLGNTSAEAVSVDLTGLTVGGTTAEELVLLGELYASGLFFPEPGRRIRRAKQNTGTKTGLWANPTDLYAFLQNLQIRLPVTASRSSNPEYHHSEDSSETLPDPKFLHPLR